MKNNNLISILTIIILLGSAGCDKFSEQKVEKVVDTGAKLIFYVGDVTINGSKPVLDHLFTGKIKVETGVESSAEFKFGKDTGIQIRENSIVEIVKNADVMEPTVIKGAVLNMVERGIKYRLASATGVIAVRGTVFYVNHLSDEEVYICACNGSIDIGDGTNVIKGVSAPHHKAHVLNLEGELIEAGMQYHTDLEIFDMMYRLGEPK